MRDESRKHESGANVGLLGAEKSGKAVQFSYEDNLKLVAFTQQAVHGAVGEDAGPIGAFDVIGRDRRLAWQNLGTITKAQAMDGFVDLLDRLCASFRPYAEAIKKDREEKAREQLELERQRHEQLEEERLREKEQQLVEEQRNRDEVQKRRLQDALNQQTYHQFRAYAEKQYPGNPEQQALLILQLQNEHYHQYMQQLHAQIATEKNERQDGDDGAEAVAHALKSGQLEEHEAADSDDNESDGFPPISPANMWTKPDIETFKAEVAAGKGEGVIKVGHGDIVTVRVPTHEGGSCLYWEFATDSYDIGFGVYFEWGKPTTNEVSVQVSDSDEDDDAADGDDDDEGKFVISARCINPSNADRFFQTFRTTMTSSRAATAPKAERHRCGCERPFRASCPSIGANATWKSTSARTRTQAKASTC